MQGVAGNHPSAFAVSSFLNQDGSYDYEINDQDRASIDTVDSASRGASPQRLTEAQANAVLGQYGVMVDNGVQRSVDGFELTPAASNMVSGNSGDPTLPDVDGSTLTADALGTQLTVLPSESMSAGAMAWAELMEMARSGQVDMAMAKEIRQALEKAKYEAKQEALDAQARKIDAERSGAWMNVVVQAVGVGASLAGPAMKELDIPGIGEVGAGAANAIAQSAPKLVGAAGDAISKSFGPQATANEEDLYARSRELEAEKLDQYIDASRSNYDEAKEQMKLAMRILDQYIDRQTQITQAITR